MTWNSFAFSNKQTNKPPPNPHFVFFNYSDNVFSMEKNLKDKQKEKTVTVVPKGKCAHLYEV